MYNRNNMTINREKEKNYIGGRGGCGGHGLLEVI
jgi:hypothetical protein